MKAYLILEDGTQFCGKPLGITGLTIGETVFNTGMTGYQEVLTDASYYGQIVAMTYPLIGNYGVNPYDPEGEKVNVRGFIVRESCDTPSNFRSVGTIDDYLKKNNIVGIQGIDTRALTRIIRERGTLNGAILSGVEEFDKEELLQKIKAYKIERAVESVTIEKPIYEQTDRPGYRVAVMDFGYKKNIVRSLKSRGCNVTVYPGTAKAQDVLSENPDGVMLTNGPGDPADNIGIIQEIGKIIQTKTPVFGICLGHQLVALSYGFATGKLKYGHRGANHPVKAFLKNRTYITSQNHGYAVQSDTVDDSKAEISHINMNDGTCEGIIYKNEPVFTVQFHPEACPGPQDTSYLFDDFIRLMSKNK